MQPVFIDFASQPPRTGEAVIRLNGAFARTDHVAFDAGGSVEVDFEVPPEGVGDEATLRFRGLASKLGEQTGFAPVTVSVNDTPVLERYTIPNGGGIPHETWWAVPRETFRLGTNTLRIAVADDARSHLWLYRILLESVDKRNSAETALLEAGFTEPVLTYRTQRRPVGEGAWQEGPTLSVYVDSAERGMPAQLGWRAANGAEGSVSFQSDLSTWYGHWRSPDGTWNDMRGFCTSRGAASDLPDGAVRRFRTQASWGDNTQWYDGCPLELSVDTGDGPLERLHWRDQRESCASIGFSAGPDGERFTGWSQRAFEGPVGYRGFAVASEEPQPHLDDDLSPQSLPPELDEAVKAVAQLAESATRKFATWLSQQR